MSVPLSGGGVSARTTLLMAFCCEGASLAVLSWLHDRRVGVADRRVWSAALVLAVGLPCVWIVVAPYLGVVLVDAVTGGLRDGMIRYPAKACSVLAFGYVRARRVDRGDWSDVGLDGGDLMARWRELLASILIGLPTSWLVWSVVLQVFGGTV